MINVILLQRWNEYPVNTKLAVTVGQAEILLARGMIAIPAKSVKEKHQNAKRLSNRK